MTSEPYEFPGPARSPNYEIVGTAYRGHSIMGLIKRLPQFGSPHIQEYTAQLVPEPDNPYDPNAVGVRIDGWLVGYLAREDAAAYAPVMHRILAAGHQPRTRCNLRVYRNESSRYDVPIDAYARIYLPDPDRIVPLNTVPTPGAALLPWGNAAQVRGEEDHLDHLFEYVPPGGAGLVVVTLHEAAHKLKNGTEKPIVEVRLDGERIGRMTPAVAAHFLPTIRHAHDLDKSLAAWARLEGSSLAVNITVQAAKANEVSDEWLNSPPAPPRTIPATADRAAIPKAFQTDNQSRIEASPRPDRKTKQSASRRKDASGTKAGPQPAAQPPVGSGPPAFGANPSYPVNRGPAGYNPADHIQQEGKGTPGKKAAGGGCCGCLTLLIVFIVLAILFL